MILSIVKYCKMSLYRLGIVSDMRKILIIVLIGFTLPIIQGCGILGGQSGSTSADTDPVDTVGVKAAKDLSESEQLEFNSRYFDALTNRHIGKPEKAIRLFKKCRRIKPTAPSVYYELSKLYKNNGKSDEALTYAKESVKYGDDQYWYLKNLAKIYRRRKDYKQAASTMEKMIDKHEPGPRFFFQLANVYLRQQKLNKAIKVYDRFEKEFGADQQVTNQKKRIYLRQNKVEKAADVIRNMIKNEPENLNHYRELADIYMANEKQKKALEVYEKMLAIDPGNGKAQMALANYYKQRGKTDTAFSYLEKAFKNPDLSADQKVKFMLSQYLKRGMNDEIERDAFKLAEILVQEHPENAKTHAMYGDLLYRDDQSEKARIHYLKSLNYKQDNFSVWQNLLQINYQLQDFEALKEKSEKALTYFPNQPIVYFYSGIANKEFGQLEKAVSQFETGLNLNVNNENLKTQFYSNLAMTYHDMKNYVECDKNFEKALDLNPNDPYILNNYSWYLALRGEKLEKARKMSDKSLELQPSNSAYLDTYGWIVYKQGKFQKAKEYVGKALERNPGDPELLEHYGDILYKLKKKDEAVKYWKKAKKNGGNQAILSEKITKKALLD